MTQPAVPRLSESQFTTEYLLGSNAGPVDIRCTEDINEDDARAILAFAQRHNHSGRLWMIEIHPIGPIVELWVMTEGHETYMRDCMPRIRNYFEKGN